MTLSYRFGIFAIVLVGMFFFWGSKISPERAAPIPSYPPVDPRNLTYTVDERTVPLQDGAHEEPILRSDLNDKTFIVQAAEGDLDGTYGKDYAVILINQPGEKGTFYYLYAILSRPGQPLVTKEILLGNRVRPTSLQIIGNLVEVNLIDRAPNEPDSAEPTPLRVFRYRIAGEPPTLMPVQ